MPSLNLTPDLITRFICLPGTALIKCSPAELMTDSGKCSKGCVFSTGGGPHLCREPDCTYRPMLYKPEAAADWERKQMAVREGKVIKLDAACRGAGIMLVRRMNHDVKPSKGNLWWDDADSMQVRPGSTVYYLGRQDEADDEYVVVRIGQIVGVRNGA